MACRQSSNCLRTRPSGLSLVAGRRSRERGRNKMGRGRSPGSCAISQRCRPLARRRTPNETPAAQERTRPLETVLSFPWSRLSLRLHTTPSSLFPEWAGRSAIGRGRRTSSCGDLIGGGGRGGGGGSGRAMKICNYSRRLHRLTSIRLPAASWTVRVVGPLAECLFDGSG